jgi:hypothetical protein
VKINKKENPDIAKLSNIIFYNISILKYIRIKIFKINIE